MCMDFWLSMFFEWLWFPLFTKRWAGGRRHTGIARNQHCRYTSSARLGQGWESVAVEVFVRSVAYIEGDRVTESRVKGCRL
jgi:hypothetical protein